MAEVRTCKFLGYTIGTKGELYIAKASKAKIKKATNEALKRSSGQTLTKVIQEVNRKTIGWVNYFRLAKCKSFLTQLDSHIRRRIRCVKLKQCKKPSGIIRFMRSQEVDIDASKRIAYLRKGWWRRSLNQEISRAMPNEWIENVLGYKPMLDHYCRLENC